MSSTTSNTPKELNNVMAALGGAAGTFVPYATLTHVLGLPFAINLYEASPAQFVCGGVSLVIGTVAAVLYHKWIAQGDLIEEVVEERA